MAESDLAAKISSMIFDAALKASTSEYAVDGAEAVDRIATTAHDLVVAMEAENARLRDRITELEVDVLQKHVIAGKVVDESHYQKVRIAKLEGALRPFAEAADRVDELARKVTVSENGEYHVRVGDLRKARAALQRTGSQAAPKSEIESTLRAGLDLCHYEIDRAINQAAPSEDGDDAADIALARRARWGIVDDGAGQR